MASGLNDLFNSDVQLKPRKTYQIQSVSKDLTGKAASQTGGRRRAYGFIFFLAVAFLFITPTNLFAQCGTPGQQGNGGTLTGVVNAYWPGTATANAAATSITLGTSRGAATPIASGNLLLVIQMQDAAIDSDNDDGYGNGTAGGTASGYSNANNAGRFEFVRATNAVPVGGGTVNFVGTGTGSGLLNQYTNAAATATQGQRRFQVIRVPQYTAAILSSGLTAAAWNGTTGGVLAIDVSQQLTLGGTVSVNGLGFRGAGSPQRAGGSGGTNADYRNLATLLFHGLKGEGIAGTPRLVWDAATGTVVDTGIEGYPNGSTGRGAPGTAGGGGNDGNPAANDQNSGGGGGGNGGTGGIGGNSWSTNLVIGGYGGSPFAQVANNRLVLGGGGGGGTRNNSDGITGAGSGAAGGGIVIIRARNVAGTGTITANGSAAFNDTLNDGAGGGGAGGSILISSISGTLTGLTVNAIGGRGGDAWRTEAPNGNPGERHGPGGGGAGGVVRISSAAASLSVAAGTNGITTTSSSAFGAAPGTIGASVTNVTAATIPGVQSGAQCSPTAVRLRSFDATTYGNAVVLQWQTGYEIDNLGFQIYREQYGKRVAITPSMIAGSALISRSGSELTAGYSYAWQDRFSDEQQTIGVQYWLEDLDLDGTSTMYGPFTPAKSTGSAGDTQRARLLSDLGTVDASSNAVSEWPESSNISDRRNLELGNDDQHPQLEQQWTLAGQNAVKISVRQDGWQLVSHDELIAAGLDPAADLDRLQLFSDGVEQAISVLPKGAIEFYGQGLNTTSTDTRVYWLVVGSERGKRVQRIDAGPFDAGIAPSSFLSTVERRDRVIRFPALLNGEDDNFFGPAISAQPVDQRLVLNGLDQASGANGVLEVALQGLTAHPHQVTVQVNGVEVGVVDFDNREHPHVTLTVPLSILVEGQNVVTLTRSGVGATDVTLVDFVRLSYARQYRAESNRLLFSAGSGQAVRVDGFTDSRVRVFDITNSADVKELYVSPQAVWGGYGFTLLPSKSARNLLAISSAESNHPFGISRNEPSQWNASTNAADFVIVTHHRFRQAVEPLRLSRQRQRLKTVVVDIEDVFDEFSSGAYSPLAIRDFLARASTAWQRAPRYVLFVGDATFDPRRYFGGTGDGDLIPGMLLDTSFMETTSDDALADFNNDGLADMAVGRLPVRTEDEARAMVARILSFDNGVPVNLTERGALIVSDRPDGFDFQGAATALSADLPTRMPVQMINRADGDAAAVHNQIMTGINRGPMLVTYLGHGSVGVWTGDGLLSVADTGTMTNEDRLPLFVMTTCLNGSYMEIGSDSLGEALVKAPQGGAIAAWASSGLTEPGGQLVATRAFYQSLFETNTIRLGDAIRQAKESTTDIDIRRTWILLGDPTMRMR
jgi:hypothetical protein